MWLPLRNRRALPWWLLTTVLLGLLFHLGHAAQPVRLILRNGDRLTGTIIEENASRVILTNVVVGRVQIPISQIEKREPIVATVAAQPPSAPNTNAPTGLLLPRPSVEQSKRLEELANLFRTERITAAQFEKRRATILGPAAPASPKPWSGEILSGIDLGYGLKSRQYYSGRFKLNFTDKRLRNSFDSLFSYGKTDGELSANRLDATDKVDYDLDKRNYVYALGAAGFDEIREISHYLQAGTGVGRRLVTRTNFVLNAEFGGSYQLQNFYEGEDPHLFYYRLAEELKWSISSKVTFDEKLEYTPQWNDLGEFKIRGEINLRYWLLNNLSLNLTVIDLYDTRVAMDEDDDDLPKNDLQIRSSIGVKF